MRWSLAHRGAKRTLRAGLARMRRQAAPNLPGATRPVHPFDAQYGVDTGGFIGGGELSDGTANSRWITAYHAVPPSRFAAVIERWRNLPGTAPLSDVVFLDLGCGKGRALLLAAEVGFRDVLGVELNAPLAAVAELNLQRWQALDRMRSPARVLHADATALTLPTPPLLVFLYNPFQAPVLRRVLERLDSLPAAPGTIDIVYMVPAHEAVFADFPQFTRLWTGPMGAVDEDIASPEDRCSLYRR
jgi:SAM-dependent methyltransferase